MTMQQKKVISRIPRVVEMPARTDRIGLSRDIAHFAVLDRVLHVVIPVLLPLNIADTFPLATFDFFIGFLPSVQSYYSLCREFKVISFYSQEHNGRIQISSLVGAGVVA
jgi:hypothetical protein